MLVAGVALSAAFAVNMKDHPELRLAGCVATGLCVFGIFLTVSRGGLIALAASMVAAIIFSGRWRPFVVVSAVLVLVPASTTSPCWRHEKPRNG